MKQKAENIQKMALRGQYASLCDGDKAKFRDAYLSRSGMPYSTFYNKLNNDGFRPLEYTLFKELLTEFTPCIEM